MQKRGVSQIDWIISLALFLLYITWFFAFINPQITFASNEDSTLDFLIDDFYDEFKWSVHKFPLFIESNNTPKYQPIILSYVSNRTDLKFTDGTNYVFWNNKIILLANLPSNINTFWILSGTNYNQEYGSSGFDIENKAVSTENLSVRFDEGLPESAWYKDEEKFDRGEYKINGFDFTVSNYTIQDFGFMAMYTTKIQNLNHTTLVFDKNQEIYNYFVTESKEDYLLTIELDIDDYDSYYSNNLYFGDFGYGKSVKSVNFSHNSLTLYGPDALTIFLDDNAHFNLSFYNQTLHLKMDIIVSNDYLYRYVFHEGDYGDIRRSYHNARFGIIKKIEGIDMDNIETNYTHLKNKWVFEKDFKINVYDNSSSYTYLYDPKYEIGSYTPGRKSVVSKTKDFFQLTEEGEYKPMSVNFRIW